MTVNGDATQSLWAEFTDLSRRVAALEAASSPRTLAEIEKDAVRSALARHGGNKVSAAAELGITLKTLNNKVNLYTENSG